MYLELKVTYPEDERYDVERWLRDVAYVVRNFTEGDDYITKIEHTDGGVMREFKIMEKTNGSP